ncbi:oxidative damage protection protein [Candidatus Profftia tarda]|nr:oxidative damage protection protein [Candidatus Profftia tarda]
MYRKIFCSFFKEEKEGQEFQIYPGELGKRIFNEISKEAWSRWLQKQTILINDRKLSLINPNDRKLLEQEMIQFLFEGHDIYSSGYTPVRN